MIDTKHTYTKKIGEHYTIQIVKMSKAHNNDWMCSLLYKDEIIRIRAIHKKKTRVETPDDRRIIELHEEGDELSDAFEILYALNYKNMLTSMREFGFTQQ